MVGTITQLEGGWGAVGTQSYFREPPLPFPFFTDEERAVVGYRTEVMDRCVFRCFLYFSAHTLSVLVLSTGRNGFFGRRSRGFGFGVLSFLCGP
jgi:hypothetical protein